MFSNVESNSRIVPAWIGLISVMEFTETSFNMLQANNPNQIGDHHPLCHRNHHVKVHKKKFLRTFKIIENSRGKYIIINVNNLSRRLHARRRIDNFNPSENLVIFWNVGLRRLKIIPKKCLQSFWFQFIFSRSIFKVWHVPYVLGTLLWTILVIHRTISDVESYSFLYAVDAATFRL